MGRPTVLTEPTKKRILEALRLGCSRKTAAQLAGIAESTLRLNMDKGRRLPVDSTAPLRRFHDAVLEAEAHPRERALGIIYREMDNRPDLAWKFVERREPGYAPPMPTMPVQPAGPVIVQLAFSGRSPLQLAPAIEGEVIEQDDEPGADPTAG